MPRTTASLIFAALLKCCGHFTAVIDPPKIAALAETRDRYANAFERLGAEAIACAETVPCSTGNALRT